MTLRQDKLNVLFKKLIAQFLGPQIDGGFVTVMECVVSKDIKYAKVLVGIYPENKKDIVMSKIQDQQKDLQNFLQKNTRMKSVPHITFIIDTSEEKREKISKLLGT